MTPTERETLLKGMYELHILVASDDKQKAIFAITESHRNIKDMQQCDQCKDYFQHGTMDGRFCQRCAAVLETLSDFGQDDISF